MMDNVTGHAMIGMVSAGLFPTSKPATLSSSSLLSTSILMWPSFSCRCWKLARAA